MTTVQLNTVTRRLEVFSSARDVQARAEIADHKAAADPHPQYLGPSNVAAIATSGDAGDLIAGTVPDGRMPGWTGYTAPTKAALEAINVPAAVDALSLLGYGAIGDGGGAPYKRVPSEPAHPHKIQSADGAWWEELFAVDVTVNIPSDFATLQEAIDRLSKQPVRRGARIILNIESGHALTAGIVIENGDYSHFTITSTDAIVSLDASFPAGGSLMVGTNCRLPNLGILVDCNLHSVGRFIRVEKGSSLYILDGCGAINGGGAPDTDAESQGLFVYANSRVWGSNVKFSGWVGRGAWINHCSLARLPDSDFSNCDNEGVFVSRGCTFIAESSNFSGAGVAGLRVRRSYAVVVPTAIATNFDNCANGLIAEMGATVVASVRAGIKPTASGCSGAGVVVQTFSNAYIQGMVINNSTLDAVRCDGNSRIDALEVAIDTVGRDAFVCREGSYIYAENAVVTGVTGHLLVGDKASIFNAPGVTATAIGSAEGAIVLNGAYANVSNGDLSNATGRVARLLNGSELLAISLTATGSGGRAIDCESSKANVTSANLSGAATNGIRAIYGSDVIAHGANAQMGSVAAATDVAIGQGSIVKFASGTGGTNVAVNTLTSAGVIFQ